MRLPLRLIGLLLVLALPGWWAAAQNGYPEPLETHINDFANVLLPDTEDRLRGLLADLKAEKDIEVVVVTIGWMENYSTGDQTVEAFATHLFNTWGIGSGQFSSGVLLLVAVDDRKVRIEVGSMYETILDEPMQGIIDEFILPAFREGDYAGGVVQGVRGIYYQMTGQFPAELPAPAIPSAPARSSRSSDSGDGLMGVLVVLFILISVGSWAWRLMNGGEWDDADGSNWSESSRRRSSWGSSSSYRPSSSGRSSRSSSRKHGGGRSSGGGASGSW